MSGPDGTRTRICRLLPIKVQAHEGDRRESNPLKPDPQSGAAPFGFDHHNAPKRNRTSITRSSGESPSIRRPGRSSRGGNRTHIVLINSQLPYQLDTLEKSMNKQSSWALSKYKFDNPTSSVHRIGVTGIEHATSRSDRGGRI